MPLLDLLASWLVREDSVFVIPFALAAAVLVPFTVAQRRHRAMGLRVGFTLSIYTACYLIFLFLLHCSSSSTGGSSLLVPSLYRTISALHLCALLYHLAYGFTWNLRPWFIYGVGLPGYCFFLAVVLFVPGFIAVRLCSLAFALVFGRCAVAETVVAALPSPLADELVLVALFSLLFTWSILFHQAGLPALEVVDLDVDYARVHPTLCRLSVPHHRYGGDPAEVKPKTSTGAAKSFTVGQISDPHLGLFMSAGQLRSVCEEVVALRDLFSAEIQRGPYAGRQLKWALEPLASPDVRAFACLGNHDYEGLSLIQSALKSLGIRLLCDESETIIGTHYVFPERRKAEHLQKMCAKYPATITASTSAEDRDEGDGGPQSDMVTTTRLMLVHDPKGFSLIDPNERVLAFAGHNHGGQVGLETFGIRWTLPRAVFPTFTDLGLWAKGRNYWYVHRGTGQHAFPFRWGVQRERSLLRVTISSSD